MQIPTAPAPRAVFDMMRKAPSEAETKLISGHRGRSDDSGGVLQSCG